VACHVFMCIQPSAQALGSPNLFQFGTILSHQR
jgi:hypothetical protein